MHNTSKHGLQSGGKVLVRIPRNQIRPNPEQPREDFDPKELRELCDSIELQGQLTPVDVLKLSVVTADGIGYELIEGERRWRSTAMIAEDFVLDAIIKPVVNKDQQYVMSAIANAGRKSLKLMETARALAKVQRILGCTQTELAKRFAEDNSWVSKHLRLLLLDASIQARLEAGTAKRRRVSFGLAVKLAAFPQAEQVTRLQHIEDRKLNLDQAKRYLEQELRTLDPSQVDGRSLSQRPSKNFSRLDSFVRNLRQKGDLLMELKPDEFRGMFAHRNTFERRRILVDLKQCVVTLQDLVSCIESNVPDAAGSSSKVAK